MTKLAVLTVCYNAVDRTKNFLNSLKQSNSLDFEVFLIDNNSSEESKKELKEFLANENFLFDISLIEKETNDGWGMGLNRGFNYINQKHIPYTLVVTNDSLIGANTIQDAIITMDNNKEVGICAARVRDMNGNIQTVGGKIKWITLLTGITFNNKERQKEDKAYIINDDEYIDDCAWIIRSELMRNIQYPSHLFMYFEELYVQDEIKKKGLKLMSNPKIEINHEGHGSSGGENKKSPFNVFYVTRNRILWMKDKKPKWFPIFICNYFLFVLPAFVCLYVIKKRWSLIKYLFKGTSSAMKWINKKEKVLFKI